MNKYVMGVMTLATVASLAMTVPVFAQTNTNTPADIHRPESVNGPQRGQNMMRQSILGTVGAVSGNTITVLGRGGPGNKATATTTFTVNATNAKVIKNTGTSTVSAITVGDNVMVQGTITGTNVVATMIRDGIMAGPGVGFAQGPGKIGTSTNPMITGSGEPVIAGTISTISGSTISITNRSNVVYSIDTTKAKILQGKNTVTLSALKTGDTVVIQGAINGTSIVASSIIDQTKPTNSGKDTVKNPHPGFFGGIGQFFMHLFGF